MNKSKLLEVSMGVAVATMCCAAIYTGGYHKGFKKGLETGKAIEQKLAPLKGSQSVQAYLFRSTYQEHAEDSVEWFRRAANPNPPIDRSKNEVLNSLNEILTYARTLEGKSSAEIANERHQFAEQTARTILLSEKESTRRGVLRAFYHLGAVDALEPFLIRPTTNSPVQ